MFMFMLRECGVCRERNICCVRCCVRYAMTKAILFSNHVYFAVFFFFLCSTLFYSALLCSALHCSIVFCLIHFYTYIHPSHCVYMHRTMTMDNCTHGSATIALTHTHVESGALVTSTQVAKKKKQRGKKNKRIFSLKNFFAFVMNATPIAPFK